MNTTSLPKWVRERKGHNKQQCELHLRAVQTATQTASRSYTNCIYIKATQLHLGATQTASAGYTNSINIKATQLHLEATQTTTQTAYESYKHTVYR
jgi:hypothetical protein